MFELAQRFIVPAALSLLPRQLDTPEARSLLLAIGLQESEFSKRRQVTSNPTYAPARGFWQFERPGATTEVLVNAHTRPLLLPALEALRYPADGTVCWEAFEHNDVLACVFARLFLLTSPRANPGPAAAAAGWQVYVSTWRPGRPRPDDWPANYARAWAVTA